MHSILPYILAPTLFLGPLFATYLDRTFQIRSNSPKSIRGRISNIGLIEIRNYLVVRSFTSSTSAPASNRDLFCVQSFSSFATMLIEIQGPLTEELVFRSTILSISLLGRFSIRSLIFGTPFWFGLAHAHHALEVYRKAGGGRDAAVQAIGGCRMFLQSLDALEFEIDSCLLVFGNERSRCETLTQTVVFQLMYTTLFGWFASYLFLRTGEFGVPFVFRCYFRHPCTFRNHTTRPSQVAPTRLHPVPKFPLLITRA